MLPVGHTPAVRRCLCLFLACLAPGCLDFDGAYNRYSEANAGCTAAVGSVGEVYNRSAPAEPSVMLTIWTYIGAIHSANSWSYGPVVTDTSQDYVCRTREQLWADVTFAHDELCLQVPGEDVSITEVLREVENPDPIYSTAHVVRCP